LLLILALLTAMGVLGRSFLGTLSRAAILDDDPSTHLFFSVVIGL
jgi:hypothetical protein